MVHCWASAATPNARGEGRLDHARELSTIVRPHHGSRTYAAVGGLRDRRLIADRALFLLTMRGGLAFKFRWGAERAVAGA